MAAQLVIETPPWLGCALTYSDGQVVRFGPDERDAGDIPLQASHDTQIPGGYGDGGIVLSRPPQIEADDAKLFAHARFYLPGDVTCYEGRVKGVPQVGVSEIRLELEGWSAHLDDDEFFRFLGVHNDLTAWDGPSVQRQLDLVAQGAQPQQDGGAEPDTTGLPALATRFMGQWAQKVRCEAKLMVEGMGIAELRGAWKRGANTLHTDPNMSWKAALGTDDVNVVVDATAELKAAGPGEFTLSATDTRKVATVWLEHAIAGGNDGVPYDIFWTVLSVLGDHGLTPRQLADGRWGILGSDAIRHGIDAGAPMLTYSEDSVEESGFVLPHLVHTDGGVRGLVEEVTGLGGARNVPNDWGVYDEREFFWRSPGTYGRSWRVRRDETAEPTEGGPTIEERCAGVVISYQDSAGRRHSVGPPGSGAEYETEGLADTDPRNPASRISGRIKHRDVGITTQEGAVLIGGLLLREQNADARRVTVKVTETARDEAGNRHPVALMRAGDRLLIEDEDADQPEELPLNSTSYDHDELAVTANAGAVPQTIDVLLARLGAVTPG